MPFREIVITFLFPTRWNHITYPQPPKSSRACPLSKLFLAKSQITAAPGAVLI